MSLSGKSCSARKISHLLLALVPVCLIAACASPPPAPVADREVEKRVREPAQQQNSGVQVFPLQSPAVKALLQDARDAEAAGDYDLAAVSLERALRIQPRDPEILQSLAEIQLHKKDYEQALNFAIRSYDAGPRVGEICGRNWNTVGVAREHAGDANGAAEARRRAGECMKTKPKSY